MKWPNNLLVVVATCLPVMIGLFFAEPMTSTTLTHPKIQTTAHKAGAETPQQEPPISFWERLTSDPVAAFTAILTAFTGLLVFVTYKQVRLANQEFVATHRPRILVRFVEGEEPKGGKKPSAEIRMANVGETAAKVIAMGVDIFSRLPDGRTIHGWNAIPQPLPDSSKIQPSQELKVNVMGGRSLDETDEFTLSTGDSQLCLIGIVSYLDDNQTVRVTSFVRLYDVERRRYRRAAKDDPYTDYEYAN